MSKTDGENKGETAKKANKMAKPNKSVRPFNFPNYGVTIEATDIRAAQAKLKTHLKPKSNKDD